MLFGHKVMKAIDTEEEGVKNLARKDKFIGVRERE